MNKDLIALAEKCGFSPFPEMGDTSSRWIVLGDQLEAFAAALSSATPAGGGLRSAAQAAINVFTSLDGVKMTFKQSADIGVAKQWLVDALAASPVPAVEGLTDDFKKWAGKDVTETTPEGDWEEIQ